jgi:two-component system sensor histidine kinase FlrB
MDRLTEPFFTTKEPGTGLGLAVVKSVAVAHQGDLVIENLIDGGACFTLCLPLAPMEVSDVA